MSNRFIKETAKAWGLTFKEVRKLYQWIDYTIPKHRQSVVFVSLLKRKRAGNKQVYLNGLFS